VADALEPLARLGHVDVDYHEPNCMIPRNKEPYNAYNTMVRGCITRSGGDQNYHPSGTRDFTPRELALLQSFPLNYHFKGSNTEARKQIGNAFPPVVAREIFHVIAQTLEAFDHGFINAEDEIHDLDALLAERNINIPAQRTVRPLFGEDAYDPITQSPFRYLAGNRNGADSGQRNRQRRSALFRRARSIEPAEPRIRQQQRRRNLFGLMGSDYDEDESVIYESRKERRARVLREELFVAEAMGNIYSLDDSD
jgi:DNA (cytosine-5)-methyltransferase 1